MTANVKPFLYFLEQQLRADNVDHIELALRLLLFLDYFLLVAIALTASQLLFQHLFFHLEFS